MPVEEEACCELERRLGALVGCHGFRASEVDHQLCEVGSEMLLPKELAVPRHQLCRCGWTTCLLCYTPALGDSPLAVRLEQVVVAASVRHVAL